jgi:hypothetical protein
MDLLVVPTIGFRLLYAFVGSPAHLLSGGHVPSDGRMGCAADRRSLRLVGSIRRECIDHVIVLGEGHLRKISNSTRIATTAYELTSFGQRRANHHIGQIVAIQCSVASTTLTFGPSFR